MNIILFYHVQRLDSFLTKNKYLHVFAKSFYNVIITLKKTKIINTHRGLNYINIIRHVLVYKYDGGTTR